jgi:pimeloyl-ACP methyl ester carboxylesterase
MRTAAVAALVFAGLLPAAARAGEGPKVVHLKTRDGLTLEADWYSGGEGMPGIVGLHMYPADRTSWKPLAEHRPEGFHFLAVDLRGYGGSKVQDGKDLSPRVKDRDPTLFQAMWQDAEAAVKFLRTEAKCDPKRIGIVGASVGCSLAIDTAVRDGRIAGVACLSPGTNYFGIPTVDTIKSWPAGTPLLLVSPEGEAEGGAKPLAAELKGRPEVELRSVPGGREMHGTLMLDLVRKRLGLWLMSALRREMLDGVLDATEKSSIVPLPAAEGAPEARGRVQGDASALNVYWRREAQGGSGTGNLELLVTILDGNRQVVANKRLRGMASGEGALLKAWMDTWDGQKWQEQPLGQVPGLAMIRGDLLEARLPWTIFGVTSTTLLEWHLWIDGARELPRPEPLKNPRHATFVMDDWEP